MGQSSTEVRATDSINAPNLEHISVGRGVAGKGARRLGDRCLVRLLRVQRPSHECARSVARKGLTKVLQNNAMKKLFFISLSAALLWVGSAATFAQVDRSDPEALIKTATQLILNEARQGAIREVMPRA